MGVPLLTAWALPTGHGLSHTHTPHRKLAISAAEKSPPASSPLQELGFWYPGTQRPLAGPTANGQRWPSQIIQCPVVTTETRRKPTRRERRTKSRGAKKTTDPKRGQGGKRGAHVAIGRSAGHRFNRFISMLNYAPRYFPSRDFRLP
jgi:hypothetical protein